jgi:hypothetical protein
MRETQQRRMLFSCLFHFCITDFLPNGLHSRPADTFSNRWHCPALLLNLLMPMQSLVGAAI